VLVLAGLFASISSNNARVIGCILGLLVTADAMKVAAFAIVALVLLFLSAAWFVVPREAAKSVGAASPRPWDPYQGSAN